MKLQELRDRGGFVDAVPVKKEVTWKRKDGAGVEQSDTFFIHVRRQSFGIIERLLSGDDQRSRSAVLISNSVLFGEQADEVMSYDDAYQLDASLAHVLIRAVNEVNARKN